MSKQFPHKPSTLSGLRDSLISLFNPLQGLRESYEQNNYGKVLTPEERLQLYRKRLSLEQEQIELEILAERSRQLAVTLEVSKNPVRDDSQTSENSEELLPPSTFSIKLEGCVLIVQDSRIRLKPSLASILEVLWDEKNHLVSEIIKVVYGSHYADDKDRRTNLSKRVSELNDTLDLDDAFGHSIFKHGLNERWIESFGTAEEAVYRLRKPRGK